MIEFKPTRKGLLSGEFRDRYGALCSVQESSFVEETCLWLGVEVDMHGNPCPSQMHLTRSMAAELMNVLRHFVRTGHLGTDDAPISVGRWVRSIDPADLEHPLIGRIVAIQEDVVYIQAQSPIPDRVVVKSSFFAYWEFTDPPVQLSSYEHMVEDDL